MKKHMLFSFLLIPIVLSCSGKSVTGGLKNGTLIPCPASPNCVVSVNADEKHQIAPLTYQGDRDQMVPLFRDLVKTMKRTTLVKETGDYLHFEFKTRIFGFVDDVEFYFPDEPVIHVRSASRKGYSDLGVNRKRVENIRKLFNEALRQMKLAKNENTSEKVEK